MVFISRKLNNNFNNKELKKRDIYFLKLTKTCQTLKIIKMF